MRGIKTEFAVGVFAIAVFAILVFMTFKVGEIFWFRPPGYRVYVHFKNTGGLDEKARIKVAGVDAGTIEKIELIEGAAKLTLRVNPEVKLYSDAGAYIKSSGLLGDRFLELKVGSKMPLLKEGDTIRNVEEVVEIDELIKTISGFSNSLEGITDELSRTLKESEARQSLKEIFANLREITKDLRTTVGENKERFTSVMKRVDSLTASLDDFIRANRGPFTNAVANLDRFSGTLNTDGRALISNLTHASMELRAMLENSRPDIEGITNSVNAVAGKIERGEGTIGKLMTDEKLYASLTNAVDGVGRAVSAIDRFKTYITLKSDYLTRIRDGKGYFYITLQPRKDKYYILGIVDDPLGSVSVVERTTDGVTVREEKVEAEIEFAAQIAKRFGNTALRGGLLESSLGAGIDHYMFKDRLILTSEVWDFRKLEHLADNPHLKVGADYFAFKHVFVTGGLDNLLNDRRRSVYIGAGIRFEDEDFKYLFGAMPNIPVK